MPDRVLYDKVQEAKKQLNRVIRGKEQVLQLLFAALFAEGHVLMEDVPGTGKTTLAKALALSVTADFSRIQFRRTCFPRIFWVPPSIPRKKGLSFSVRDLFSRICFWRMRSTGRLPAHSLHCSKR